MAAEAESLLKSGEISSMIRHGFFSPSASPFSPTRFSPRSHSPPFRSPPPTTSSSSPQSFSSFGHRSPETPPATLLEMISSEDHPQCSLVATDQRERRLRVQDRIGSVIAGEGLNWGPADVKLSVSSADEFRVSIGVHSRVLAARSRFFEEKLGRRGGVVEICECNDVEVYVDVIAMMYCGDIRRRLSGESARRVLGLLKVSAAITFDAGVAACLERLEAIPWSEDEEVEIVSVLRQLHLGEPAAEVLQRVLVESSYSSRADAIFLRLLACVLQSKNEKARGDMKTLMLGLLGEDNHRSREFADHVDVSKGTLYHLCHECLNSLLLCLSEAASAGDCHGRDRGILIADIARQADNLHWLLEILISKKMAEEFVTLWADQAELAGLHAKLSCIFRYEVSRITARLCTAIGKGQVLVPNGPRFAVLCRWLEALFDDFGWLKRACKAFDARIMEEGLCQMILALSMAQQQQILMRWFERFMKGDECPNMHKALEVWWRRAFVRRFAGVQDASQLQIVACEYPT
ncbi:hypothetical protein HPP92_006316 [Vanilla planifolia]|uniref:BTB domain-containing protein n=1 Tax=Vanilla planifolia TaxID=51239 RepID=A0A835RNL8_VANPL|nr:hypothetical protein HPP92_006316 [Vanilla planifolia]